MSKRQQRGQAGGGRSGREGGRGRRKPGGTPSHRGATFWRANSGWMEGCKPVPGSLTRKTGQSPRDQLQRKRSACLRYM